MTTNPGEATPPAPLIEHAVPPEFPTHHLTGVSVPVDFARVVTEAAAKDGILFEDQLLQWAQMGAECSRLHQAKPGRNTRK